MAATAATTFPFKDSAGNAQTGVTLPLDASGNVTISSTQLAAILTALGSPAQAGGALGAGSAIVGKVGIDPANNTVTVAAQRVESLWTDDTGAYFVRVDLGGTISWTTAAGAASAPPGTGARPAAGATVLLSRSSFQATAAGTGYSSGDYLDHFVTTDPSSGAVLGNFWIDLTTGAALASAPASANITPVAPLPNGAATATGLAGIVTALGSPFQVGGSIGAGENHVGEVGGNVGKAQAQFGPSSSTTYAGTATAGIILSAPIALAGMARKANGSGFITSATLALNVANYAEVDLVVFSISPTGTYTAGSAWTNTAADRPKICAVLKVTDWTALSTTDSVGEVTPGAKFFTCDDTTSTTTLWVVPVARGSITLAAATDATVTLRTSRN